MKSDEITQNDIWFNKLYTSLPYTKVNSFEDCMLYTRIPFGYNKAMVDEINQKIKELNLPLIATSLNPKGLFSDIIIVQPIDKKDEQHNNKKEEEA